MNPAEVVKEIFDNDQWVKDEFTANLSADILQFGAAFAESFKRFPQLDQLSSGNDQAALVAGFMYGVFDDLLVSMKLLVAGKLTASGNLMRQAIEGIAVAILCASPERITVGKKGGHEKVDYWQCVKSGDKRVYSHLSVDQLGDNWTILGVRRDAIKKLKSGRAHYNRFSHPNRITMAMRMDMGESGPVFAGGNFDKAKLPAYKVEICQRASLCTILPQLIDGLIARLETK